MKYLLIAFILSSCAVLKMRDDPIKLTVTHIQKTESGVEVYASRGYMVYFGTFDKIPDTIKRGTIITANPFNQKPSCDTCCPYVFRRIK